MLDHLFSLCEYLMKYLVCIFAAQCVTTNNQDTLSLLDKYKYQNMSMGKWYEMLIGLAKLNRGNTNPFVLELHSLFFSPSGKLSPEISVLPEIINVRNELHRRPFSERNAEKIAGHIKILLWSILGKSIFLENYLLQIVETALPNPRRKTFEYHIKNLMGSHPEFLLTPVHESTIFPYREVFLKKPTSSEYLTLFPYIVFDLCPHSQRDDVFLFEKLGKKTAYKSSQQGHIITKEVRITENSGSLR